MTRAATRTCLCCGAPTAGHVMPACWPHWNLLPEDLRSAIVKSYGRGQVSLYGESLIAAVGIWRQIGAWVRKHNRGLWLAEPDPAAPASEAPVNGNVIRLFEIRQVLPAPTFLRVRCDAKPAGCQPI